MKREFAWGKLTSRDFVSITRLLKNILVPVLGMESLIEVTNRVEKRGGWGSLRVPKVVHSYTTSEIESLEANEKEQWRWMFEELRGPVQQLVQVMLEGLDYSFQKLEFAKRPRKAAKSDLEAKVVGPPRFFRMGL